MKVQKEIHIINKKGILNTTTNSIDQRISHGHHETVSVVQKVKRSMWYAVDNDDIK